MQKKFAVYLRFVTFQNDLPLINETFFDSLQINGCPTGQVIDKNILSLLVTKQIDVEKCRSQAYDSANAMSSNSSGAPSVIKRKQPLTEYIHCRNHALNLAISFSCNNQSQVYG